MLSSGRAQNAARKPNASNVISALMRNRTTSAMLRSEQSSNKIDQSGADQVSYAFDIAHDARDQNAALGGVVECDRQAPTCA